MRARIGYAVAFGSLLSTSILASCEVQNQGQSPPGEQFFFPSGLLLDPVRNVEPVAVCSSYDGSDPSTALASELPPPSVDLPGPRYLYVANGNNDRSFNAGALMAIDLQKFWRAWYDPHRDDPAQAGCVSALAAAGSGDPSQVAAACEACDRDPRRGGVDPFCREITLPDGTMYSRCIKPPGVAVDVMTTEDLTYTTRAQDDPIRSPCRRLPLLSQVVECDENPFVVDSVEVGDFATTLAHSIEDDVLRLWLPVRGDPSITYVDVRDHQGGLCLECGDGSDVDASCSSNAAQACGDSHRLDTLRNDPTLDVLDREPFNALVWESDQPSGDPDVRGERLAFVAHSDGIQLSVVDLDGVRGGSDPAIVDLAPIYIAGAGGVGGFGLAARPCFEAGEGPLGALDPEPNVPSITQQCTRPLVYTSFRFTGQLASFTASALDVGAGVAEQVAPADRTNCMVSLRNECRLEAEAGPGERGEQDLAIMCDGLDVNESANCDGGGCREVYAGPYCATPSQVGQPCAVECEPRVRGSRRIQPALLLDTSLAIAPILGDMAFADPRGDQLLVVQTNPGALISLDTSLGVDNEPLDVPSAPPVEICAEPSRMKIYVERDDDGTPRQRYALITCFRAALVYVVDLEALRVVDAIVVGTGPHDIAIDEQREAAYIINNLEFSISVIDLSRRRSTRFQELARLGLQDPFS